MYYASDEPIPVKKMLPPKPRKSIIRRILHFTLRAIRTGYRILRISTSVLFFLLGAGLLFLVAMGLYILFGKPVTPPLRHHPSSGQLAPRQRDRMADPGYLYFSQPHAPRHMTQLRAAKNTSDSAKGGGR